MFCFASTYFLLTAWWSEIPYVSPYIIFPCLWHIPVGISCQLFGLCRWLMDNAHHLHDVSLVHVLNVPAGQSAQAKSLSSLPLSCQILGGLSLLCVTKVGVAWGVYRVVGGVLGCHLSRGWGSELFLS